jgi:hypothetical protein
LYGVSDTGVIAGTLNLFGGGAEAAVAGTVQSGLRRLPGTTRGSETAAIGADGPYVVGTEVSPGADGHPVLWTAGRPQQLPGVRTAMAVNRSGLVAGISGGGASAGWVWRNGRRTQLPGLPGGSPDSPYVTAVTETGQVAGDADGLPVVWACYTYPRYWPPERPHSIA